jgi:hypothetical protein
VGQCQIHVVATEKQVPPHGNAFHEQLRSAFANAKQRQISSTTANIANQNSRPLLACFRQEPFDGTVSNLV